MWSPGYEIRVSRAGNPLEPLSAGGWLEASQLAPLPAPDKVANLLLTMSKDLKTISKPVGFNRSSKWGERLQPRFS